MTHAEQLGRLVQLVRQANAEEVGLLLQVAEWQREHRGDTPAKPGETLRHVLELLAAVGKGQP